MLDGCAADPIPADWVMTVTSPPPSALLIAAVRCGPVLATTEYPIVPLPVPEPPEVMVSQGAHELAVQAQVWSVTATVMESVP